MTETRKAELDAMAAEAAALFLGQKPSPSPEAPSPKAPAFGGLCSSVFGAGSYAHSGLAAGQDLVLDPLARDLKKGATFATFAQVCPRLRPRPVLVLGGLSLFELEALAEAQPGNELAEAMVYVLGSQGQVLLGSDLREAFKGLKGPLATRLWRALASLQALGVETAAADPRKAPQVRAGTGSKLSGLRVQNPGQAAQARAQIGGPSTRRIFTVEDLRGIPKGGSLAIPEGGIVTDLARDEAKARGIGLDFQAP